GFIGEMSGTRVNIVVMDVNTSGHLNFFAYRLSKSQIAVKIICIITPAGGLPDVTVAPVR
ncbi:hypothetical protein PV940_10100, partial [Ligilactobacillus salivarius]